ncbi:MAG TPA: hypothetical protein VIK14_07860 [Ignavibacteria bacterium]
MDELQREPNIKAWKRIWKLRLIEEQNKEWKDLFYEITDEEEVKSLREYFVIREKEKRLDDPEGAPYRSLSR